MRWRELLSLDLRRWLPGYRPLPEPTPGREVVTFEDYPRSLRGKIQDPMWKGPHCLGASELLFILEQIRLSVRTGLPLHEGLDAAARNEFETLMTGRLGFRLRTTTGLLLTLIITAVLFLSLLYTPIVIAAAAPIGFIIASSVGLGMAHGVLARSRRAAVCGSLVNAMNRGLTLSEAMARLSNFFPKPVVSLVAVGESTNRLAETVEQLNKDVLQRFLRNQQLSGWLVYFCSLFVIQLAILGFLLFKVAPILTEMQEEMRGTAPRGVQYMPARQIPFPFPLPTLESLSTMPTWMIVNLSVLGLVALVVIAGLIVRRLAPTKSQGGGVGSSLDLYIPVYRKLLAMQNLGAGASMVGQLLKAGVPLDRALETTAESGLHPAYAAWFSEVRDRVRQGESFGDACALTLAGNMIPQSFYDAVAMGEKVGRLEDGLAYIDEQYTAAVEQRVQWWSNGLQTGTILLMGYVVLSIDISVFNILLDFVDYLLL